MSGDRWQDISAPVPLDELADPPYLRRLRAAEQPYPTSVPGSVHELRIAMLLEDRVRADGDLVYELLGFYPYGGQVVAVDGVPWRVHGVEWTEVTWLERLGGVPRPPASPRPAPVAGGKVHLSHDPVAVPTGGGTTYHCRRCGGEVMVPPWRSATGEIGPTEVGAQPCAAGLRGRAARPPMTAARWQDVGEQVTLDELRDPPYLRQLRKPEQGTVVEIVDERKVYRYDGDEWVHVRYVVVVGDRASVEDWCRSVALPGGELIPVWSRYDERRLRGLDGRHVVIVRVVRPGGALPDVAHSLEVLRQRGAVDALPGWRP